MTVTNKFKFIFFQIFGGKNILTAKENQIEINKNLHSMTKEVNNLQRKFMLERKYSKKLKKVNKKLKKVNKKFYNKNLNLFSFFKAFSIGISI